MQQFYSFLSSSILFAKFNEKELDSVIKTYATTVRVYKPGEVIYKTGDIVKSISLVIEGSLYVENEDFWGNRFILRKVTENKYFCEAHSFTKEPLYYDVIAITQCTIFFINTDSVLNYRRGDYDLHIRLAHNLLLVLANKSVALNSRANNLAHRSVREKILFFLSDQARAANSNSFDISFNRQQLSDYLAIERSSLSKELGKMQKEGMLICDKRRFILLDPPKKQTM
ncbi:MAG: Crp/Fnr family transcriptional regulator [Clostridiales bacterium]|jgi:CRP-like cAMP-binding protein|nr:Crp/Fnr family transcriptional regulator [Clostridiales bacterium]